MSDVLNKKAVQLAIIDSVRQGDQKAFSVLLCDFEPLIRTEVSKYIGSVSEEDVKDLRQIALLAFYRAVLGFDTAQKEVEFGLYAKICISNALASQMRVICRRAPEVLVSDEVTLEDGGDVSALLAEEEAAEALHSRIRQSLSPYENRVWNLFTAGYHSGEIARILGKDPHSIENAVYRIRQKLRAVLGKRR